MIASEGLLKKGGKIFLPNLINIHESLKDFDSILSPYYKIYTESDPNTNALYVATSDKDCEDKLLECPDTLINSTQMEPLWKNSNNPFYVLELRDKFIEKVIIKRKKNISYINKEIDPSEGSPIKKVKITY